MIIKLKQRKTCVSFNVLQNDPATARFTLADFQVAAVNAIWRNSKVFITLQPDDPLEGLVPYFKDITVIEIKFPAFTDGRAFSKGHRLRNQLGFTGEIRAVGDILPDQLAFLFRCGFNAVQFAAPVDPETLQFSLNAYSHSYQSVGRDKVALPALDQRQKGSRYD